MSLVLLGLWCVKTPGQFRIEPDIGLIACLHAFWYFAVIVAGRRTAFGANLLAVGGALCSTPYIVLIWLFSQWGSSATGARWMLLAVAGNVVLLLISVTGVLAHLWQRRRSNPTLAS
ncbi:MAG TPA: hypothetical protein VJT32_11910 [bacterium]|nr:hypothetical protein [bacterium]